MNDLYSWIIILQSCALSVTCYEARTDVLVTEGMNVTLPVISRRIDEILDIIWVTTGGNHFATVTPDGKVQILNDHYEGRLYSSSDLSLTITYVTAEDQGPYTANVYLSNGDSDEHNYNVIVMAKKTDDYRPTHVAPAPDPCRVSCKRNGTDVTLTCGITNKRDIAELYDPETCTCVTPSADCSHCALEESCSTGVKGVWIILAVIVSVFAVMLLTLLYRRFRLRDRQEKNNFIPAVSQDPYQTKLMH